MFAVTHCRCLTTHTQKHKKKYKKNTTNKRAAQHFMRQNPLQTIACAFIRCKFQIVSNKTESTTASGPTAVRVITSVARPLRFPRCVPRHITVPHVAIHLSIRRNNKWMPFHVHPRQRPHRPDTHPVTLPIRVNAASVPVRHNIIRL